MSGASRAYAKAAYQIAKENKEIKSWDGFLNHLCDLSQLLEIKELVKNPRVSKQNLRDLLIQALEISSPFFINFLDLLLSDKVFLSSPEIFKLFKELLAQDQGISEAILESAIDLSPEKIEILRKNLNQKYQQEFNLTLHINPELIAGFKIKTPHFVIDQSLRNQLKQLEKNLSSAALNSFALNSLSGQAGF